MRNLKESLKKMRRREDGIWSKDASIVYLGYKRDLQSEFGQMVYMRAEVIPVRALAMWSKRWGFSRFWRGQCVLS